MRPLAAGGPIETLFVDGLPNPSVPIETREVALGRGLLVDIGPSVFLRSAMGFTDQSKLLEYLINTI